MNRFGVGCAVITTFLICFEAILSENRHKIFGLAGMAHKSLNKKINYLCTYDLYDPVCNAFDTGSIHYLGKWEGVGPLEIEIFLGLVKWHRAERRGPFGAQKTRDFQGPTPSYLPK
jgi:hypothetical protein